MYTDDDLKKLAVALYHCKVFTSFMVKDPKKLKEVFVPLALMPDEELQELLDGQPAMFYNWNVNGLWDTEGNVKFFEMFVLNGEEYAKLLDVWGRLDN